MSGSDQGLDCLRSAFEAMADQARFNRHEIDSHARRLDEAIAEAAFESEQAGLVSWRSGFRIGLTIGVIVGAVLSQL